MTVFTNGYEYLAVFDLFMSLLSKHIVKREKEIKEGKCAHQFQEKS